ncbi:MaoC/PaaZ C-terminal domain-containing protein [Arthrobacter celericrescens]|uniref:MaoC/PaaZ C-terminal domain-containing protein n=1 Tax=Arthrobacter celericrescens TaxID=2320851 RepID=UPI000EA2874B|nr:MaoC/PaaZ C-terminal domain-containing protein [Arthrobacter celericrescens]
MSTDTDGSRQTVFLPEAPSLSMLYLNAAATAARRRISGARPATGLPDARHGLRGVKADVEKLTAFQHLLGETAGDFLPSGFIHALAFPVAMSVLNRDDFPLPLLGMIHLRNRADQYRAVHFSESLEIVAWVENLRGHRAGSLVDLVAEVRDNDGVLRWKGVSSYLAKGFFLPGVDKPGVDTDGVQGGGPETPFSPPVPTALWALGVDTGRNYAGVSGDFNPIHLSVLSAKALGLKRSIAHGMYLASRALAEVGPARSEAFTWEVMFEAPVFLPARVSLEISTSRSAGGHWDRSDFTGWNPRSGRRHFRGSVATLD